MDKIPPLNISPPQEQTIYLNPHQTREQLQFSITIQNPHKKNFFLYKLKLSNFDLFTASPYQGIIRPYETLTLLITIKKPLEMLTTEMSCKFLVEYGEYTEKMGDFHSAWKNLHADAVKAAQLFRFHRFKCVVQHPQSNNKSGDILNNNNNNNNSAYSVLSTSSPQNKANGNNKSAPGLLMTQQNDGINRDEEDSPEKQRLENLELKVRTQQLKIESLSWVCAEYVCKIRELEDTVKTLQAQLATKEVDTDQKHPSLHRSESQ